ncbi:MAG: hypothetical protein ACRDS0_15745 [Pseudonocardiaceae bacterium]
MPASMVTGAICATITHAQMNQVNSADGSGTYYCAWAITGRTTALHLVASAGFPLAGSQQRPWCGGMITVVGLTSTRATGPVAAPRATGSSGR